VPSLFSSSHCPLGAHYPFPAIFFFVIEQEKASGVNSEGSSPSGSFNNLFFPLARVYFVALLPLWRSIFFLPKRSSSGGWHFPPLRDAGRFPLLCFLVLFLNTWDLLGKYIFTKDTFFYRWRFPRSEHLFPFQQPFVFLEAPLTNPLFL